MTRSGSGSRAHGAGFVTESIGSGGSEVKVVMASKAWIVLGPIPRILAKSAVDWKGPDVSRSATIRRASSVPIPGNNDSSVSGAWLRLVRNFRGAVAGACSLVGRKDQANQPLVISKMTTSPTAARVISSRSIGSAAWVIAAIVVHGVPQMRSSLRQPFRWNKRSRLPRHRR